MAHVCVCVCAAKYSLSLFNIMRPVLKKCPRASRDSRGDLSLLECKVLACTAPKRKMTMSPGSMRSGTHHLPSRSKQRMLCARPTGLSGIHTPKCPSTFFSPRSRATSVSVRRRIDINQSNNYVLLLSLGKTIKEKLIFFHVCNV
jgi:hypothetical protein